MRIPRFILKDSGVTQVFHIMSRVVDKRMVLGENEKIRFYKIMRQVEGFSGCEVLTYCLMDNHFHILLRVPERPDEIAEADILERLSFIYPRKRVELIRSEIINLHQKGHKNRVDEILLTYAKRMYDVSEFVKSLKQRFTQAFNREYDRKGTLWEERYKSVLIDPKNSSLLSVAQYIDLNPVRAGIVEDSTGYRWCGIGESHRGESKARYGIWEILKFQDIHLSMDEALENYIELLRFKMGEVDQNAKAENEIDSSKCWTHGVVLGSAKFISDKLKLFGRKKIWPVQENRSSRYTIELYSLCRPRE